MNTLAPFQQRPCIQTHKVTLNSQSCSSVGHNRKPPMFGTKQFDWCKPSCLKDHSSDFQPYLCAARVTQRYFNAPVHSAGRRVSCRKPLYLRPRVLHRMMRSVANKWQGGICFPLRCSTFNNRDVSGTKRCERFKAIFENIRKWGWDYIEGIHGERRGHASLMVIILK